MHLKYNSAQAEAICHLGGPMLVLAGPGSGKTFVITERVRCLIEEHGIHPEHILVVTFSKAAALEMQERFDRLTNRQYSAVSFGTFHAIFFLILRYAYQYNAANILTDGESLRILSDILVKLRPEYAGDTDLLLSIREELTHYKSNYALLSEREKAAFTPLTCDRVTFFAAYKRYEEELRSRNRIDFEDMLLLTYELLSARPDILAYWQNRYQYLLIDEFQDINRLQYEIIRLLAAPRCNLFFVGDDDQSIYAFRGAKPEIMLQVPQDYKDVKKVLLNINYRCPAPVLEAAGNLIAANTNRYEKKLIPAKTEGVPVRISSFSDVSAENASVIREIRALLQKGCDPENIAILYRTNLQPRSLCEALSRAGIPYVMQGILPCLYDQNALQPVFAYLRLALNHFSRGDFLQVANKPVRYISRDVCADAGESFEEIKEYLYSHDKAYVVDRIRKLEHDLAAIRHMNAYAAIHYIRHIIGYDEYLIDQMPHPEEALALLDELLAMSRDYADISAYLEHVVTYREEWKELQKTQKQGTEHAKEKGIILKTFHASKGLEYPFVYLIDCNELITPHKKALFPEQIAEERRLFYVAMTRASHQLTLCSVQKRFGRNMEPSRFLGEILLPPGKLTAGNTVKHSQYGRGTILKRDGDKITIRFDGQLLPKTLSLKYCIEKQLLQLSE